MTSKDVKEISIRLLPDGFSYFNQFYPIVPGADFLQRLEDSLLQAIEQTQPQGDACGMCSVENTRFCLSPIIPTAPAAPISDSGNIDAEAYYRFSLPSTEQIEELITLTDAGHNIQFTFGIDSNLYHFLMRNIPDITFTHPLYEMIQQWSDCEEIKDNCMVAQAGSNFLNLLIFKEGHLHMANRYETTGTDNILYHLMNSWTQFDLDVLKDKLYLEASEEDLQQNIRLYIKQCISK